MATTTQEIAKAEPAAVAKADRSIKGLLQSEELRQQVRAALPRHLTPERFMRVALNATMRQPELLSCTRESFFRALLDLSAYGLEPDGRRAHLIPFRNNKTNQTEVQLIIDYKGIAELVRRSGDVSYIHADVVYEKDEFSFAYGSGAHLNHKPDLDSEDRGAVKAIYSFVKLKDGSEDFIVLSKGEVEKVRKRSRASGSGPWITDWPEMAKKTAFRRHSKWLPLSPEIRTAVEHDDEFTGVDIADALSAAENVAEPEKGTRAVKEKLRQKESAAIAEPEPAESEVRACASVEELPDPLEVPDGCLFDVGGTMYEQNAERTAWTKV